MMKKGNIIKGFEAARAKTFVYMAQALIDELGELEGKKKIFEIVWKLSRDSGERALESYLNRGEYPSWENHRRQNGPVYALAWEGGVVENSPDRKVVEYRYCPLGDAFSKLGDEAETLGDLYCDITDNAFWDGFNPKWSVVREKTFKKDGVCRLVWTKKTANNR